MRTLRLSKPISYRGLSVLQRLLSQFFTIQLPWFADQSVTLVVYKGKVINTLKG
jgi:hypothetical protein